MFHEQHGGHRLRPIYGRLVLLTICAALCTPSAFAAALGLLADAAGSRLSVFDAETDQVSWDVATEKGHALGDCAVDAEQGLGIATNSNHLISFIDLAASGQTLPEGLPISNLGVDMALSPDGALLVTAGGGALQQPLSVIDVAKRQELTVSTPFADHTSVEFCDDATLLVTTSHGRHIMPTRDNALYDAFIDDAGDIQLMGGRLSSGAQPNNASCAPGAHSGVLLDREGGITSFLLPGLKQIEKVQAAGGMGISAAFSDDGRRMFVRTTTTVEAFDFEPISGFLRADWVIEVPYSSTFYGMDQIAVHPDGGKLYVDGGDELLVLNTGDGSRYGAIAAGDATGVCFARKRPAGRTALGMVDSAQPHPAP